MSKFNLEEQTGHIFEIKSSTKFIFDQNYFKVFFGKNKMGLQKVLSSQSKPTKNESVKEAQVRAVKVRLGCVSKLLEFKSVFDQSNHVSTFEKLARLSWN